MPISARPYIEAKTLDDLLRLTGKAALEHGAEISPSKGDAKELSGIILELSDPRSRLSRTETRGKLFSALGHLCWSLSGSDLVDRISYYIPWYKKNYDSGESVQDAYGKRLFNWDGVNQVRNVITRLEDQPSSRKAVIQIFSKNDLQKTVTEGISSSPPCTCTLQFLLRGPGAGELSLYTYMRSNDWLWGLPHDVFCFTMLQEIVARSVGAEVGTYKHMVGSLHIYEKRLEKVGDFLDEGWQSTDRAMPAMPSDDPWPQIDVLLEAEEELRQGEEFDQTWSTSVDAYWEDLVRLLAVFRAFKDQNPDVIKKHIPKLDSEVYRIFAGAKRAEAAEYSS